MMPEIDYKSKARTKIKFIPLVQDTSEYTAKLLTVIARHYTDTGNKRYCEYKAGMVGGDVELKSLDFLQQVSAEIEEELQYKRLFGRSFPTNSLTNIVEFETSTDDFRVIWIAATVPPKEYDNLCYLCSMFPQLKLDVEGYYYPFPDDVEYDMKEIEHIGFVDISDFIMHIVPSYQKPINIAKNFPAITFPSYVKNMMSGLDGINHIF
jgi:hypothetical protein